MRRILLYLVTLSLLCAPALVMAWDSKIDKDKIHYVSFELNGRQHLFALKHPVTRGDNLALRAETWAVASSESSPELRSQLLIAAASFKYTDSGTLCYVTSRSGGRAYYCGNCAGGLGCAQVRATQ